MDGDAMQLAGAVVNGIVLHYYGDTALGYGLSVAVAAEAALPEMLADL